MTSTDLHRLSSVILRQVWGRDTIDGQRVAAAVHYVIAKANSSKLGHVKLNKSCGAPICSITAGTA